MFCYLTIIPQHVFLEHGATVLLQYKHNNIVIRIHFLVTSFGVMVSARILRVQVEYSTPVSAPNTGIGGTSACCADSQIRVTEVKDGFFSSFLILLLENISEVHFVYYGRIKGKKCRG